MLPYLLDARMRFAKPHKAIPSGLFVATQCRVAFPGHAQQMPCYSLGAQVHHRNGAHYQAHLKSILRRFLACYARHPIANNLQQPYCPTTGKAGAQQLAKHHRIALRLDVPAMRQR